MSRPRTHGLSLPERIRALSTVAESGCWEWQARRQPNGYPRITLRDGRSALAHRVSYEAFVGPIPAGHGLQRTCRTCARNYRLNRRTA
jgi:hypothetical protein